MSDAPSQILLNIVSAAIYQLGEGALRRSGRAAEIFAGDEDAPAVDVAIAEAVAELTSVEAIRSELGGEALRGFLTSPEMKQFGRQAFATQIERRSPEPRAGDETLAELRQVFCARLGQWTGMSAADAELHGKRLFAAFLSACDEALLRLTRQGLLDAADARAAMNTNRILDELVNMRKVLELLQEHPGSGIGELLRFESIYREQIEAIQTQIALPSLDSHHMLHVDQVYVKPWLTRASMEGSASLSYDDLLPLEESAVILGDPGSGKSTLLSKLAADIGAGAGTPKRTPIVVVLRDYAAAKARSSCSIVEFLQQRAASPHQISEMPERAFERLLRGDRAIVLFDGLDELLEIADRREIVTDVEAFRRLYRTVPTVITSRRVGYEEAPMPDPSLGILELGGLGDPEVEEYTRRIIASHPAVAEGERDELCAEFMRKSESLADLRVNPLLLGLLLERYVKTRSLPARRVEVIESCALMLFERWDSDRTIPVRFPFESKLKPAVANIAFDIYSDVSLQQGVTEAWLVRRATDYLLGRKYDDEDEAAAEAREFISLCRGRTWVFSAIGANAAGDELYRFTHRTFMEYFVAVYLVRNHATPKQLVIAIKPRIASQEWDEVCQVAVYLAADHEGAADELLREILPPPQELGMREAKNRVTFSTRALSALVPDRLDTVNAFVENWTHTLISQGAGDAASVMLSALVNSHPENQVTIARALPGTFASIFGEQRRPASKTWLLEVALNLPALVFPRADEAARERWAVASHEIAERCDEHLREFATSRLALGQAAVLHDATSLGDYLEIFGPGALFVDRILPVDGSGIPAKPWVPSLAESILMAATWGGTPGPARERERALGLNCLEFLGAWIPSHLPGNRDRWRLPWIGSSSSSWAKPSRQVSALRWSERPESSAAVDEWTAEQQFAACCLTLALFEQSPQLAGEPQGPADGTRLLDLVLPYIETRLARVGTPETDGLHSALLPSQQRILDRWGTGKFDFTHN
jgi:hypothetical protein